MVDQTNTSKVIDAIYENNTVAVKVGNAVSLLRTSGLIQSPMGWGETKEKNKHVSAAFLTVKIVEVHIFTDRSFKLYTRAL